MKLNTEELFEFVRVFGHTGETGRGQLARDLADASDKITDQLATRLVEQETELGKQDAELEHLRDQFTAAQQLSATLITRLEAAEGDLLTREKALKQLDSMIKLRDQEIATLRAELFPVETELRTNLASDCVIIRQGERKDGGQ